MNNQTTITIDTDTFVFDMPDGSHRTSAIEGGMSLAANLRKAFRDATLAGPAAALVVDTPVMLVPADELESEDDYNIEAMYDSVITGHKGEGKHTEQLPEQDAVAVFPVCDDLLTVCGDHYATVTLRHAMAAEWRRQHAIAAKERSARCLFACFHAGKVDITAFAHRRFAFQTAFDAAHSHDALYYILYVWRTLGMDAKVDKLFISGTTPHHEWLMARLPAYLKHVKQCG